MRKVLEVDRLDEFIQFYKPVELSHRSFVDDYIPSTEIIIEHKSRDANLDVSAKQSDEDINTPA